MIVIGIKTDNSHCHEIKEQLDAGGIEYEQRYVLTDSPDWRTDGSIEMIAASVMDDGILPILKIDGYWMSSKEALGELGLAPKPRFGSWRLKVGDQKKIADPV